MKNYISIQNLSIFILGCLFIAMSIFGLGHVNMMVGGFGVFLLKAIINKDFSSKPLTSILNITIYTLTIGILPSIVNLNPFSGLLINFFAIFFILYMLVYSLKETIYVPFLLGYSFFLASDATGHDLKLRVLGLLIVAVISVIFQIIYFNFQGINRAFTNLNKSLLLLSNMLNESDNADKLEVTKKALEVRIQTWNKDILNNKQNTFYLTKDENVQLNLVSSISSFKRKILNLSVDSKFELNDINILIDKLRKFIKGDYKRYLLIEDFSYFNNKYKSIECSDNYYELKEIINIIFSLSLTLYDIKKGTIKVSKRSKIRDYIALEKNLFRDFRKGSSRFTFSFRTALLMSITYFFVSYFNLKHGSWALYTIVSISQPYYDITKQKGFDRLRGTVIGAIIFTIANLIFTGFNERLIMIFIAIYFVICLVNYSKRIVATTVMSLMIVSISTNGHMLLVTWDRFFYVLVGILIVIIGSLLILPYKLETEIKDLSDIYYKTCNDALISLLHIYDDDEKRQEIDNLILKGHNIESKIAVKNSAYDIKILNDYISEGTMILENIHKIINRVSYYDTNLLSNRFERTIRLNYMKKDIDSIKNLEFASPESIMNKYFKDIKNKSELLIYKDMFDILLASRRLTYLKDKIDIISQKKL
ncbi:MAG: FUSC family protein [Sarcina sp.]